MAPIDFVVPYVDCNDPEWQQRFEECNHCDPSMQRYRDNGTLLYQLRGIEAFMPWIRYVYLLVQSESQIPKWINRKNPRLKITLHEDYIPRQYLPTFKSSNIELNIHHINELAENFILANDDMIAVKPIMVEHFFKEDRPVQPKEENPAYVAPSDTAVMQNKVFRIAQLERIYLNSAAFKGLQHKHLFIPYNKSFWKRVIDRFKLSFTVSFSEKNYRGFLDLNHWLISDMQILSGFSIIDNSLNTTGYISLEDNTSEDEINKTIKDSEVICLNDCLSKDISNPEIIAKTLGKILPNKSSFEV